MKINDTILGGLFLILAGALWFGSGALPNPTSQPYGPDFFPRILAAALAFAAAALCVAGLRQRRPVAEFEPWMRDPRALVRVALVPAGVALFVLFAAPVGFLPCSVVLLAALQIADEVPVLPALATALLVALAVHSAFYLGLDVQLPWGLLEPVRW